MLRHPGICSYSRAFRRICLPALAAFFTAIGTTAPAAGITPFPACADDMESVLRREKPCRRQCGGLVSLFKAYSISPSGNSSRCSNPSATSARRRCRPCAAGLPQR
jgi:hypothetical protein